MLAAHYTQNQSVNKGFPGDRLKWALAQDLDPTAKLVLVVLTDHYNVAREDTYPSAGKIAERSGFCSKTITRALARLEGAGLIEATRKVGRATVWRLHIGPRLVEQVDQVDPQEPNPPVTKNRTPRPTWLKQRVKDLTYWREVYDGGGDLDGMPLHIAEQIFEESRQTPVDKPVSKSADLGNRVPGTPDSKSQVPRTQSPPNKKREQDKFNKKSQKRQPGTADATTTTNQSSPLDNPMGLNLVETWETLTGSKMNGHNRPGKVYRAEAFLES